jgi:hypothetical protein
MVGVFDTSDLTGPGAEAADILLAAGYLLPRECLGDLLTDVRAIKEKHCGNPDVPVKWNIRGMDRALGLHGCGDLQGQLLETSNSLRSDLLSSLNEHNATLFLSVIHAYSYRRDVLRGVRANLGRFVFANTLMRVGLCRSNTRDRRRTEVLLDWPESGQPMPFVTEYCSGWKNGRSEHDGRHVGYRCGALRDLGFEPSPTFGVTDADVRLQLADLVVGMSRVFINHAMGRVGAAEFGVAEFGGLLPRFFSHGGLVMGRGITVAPTNGVLSGQILEAIRARR